jgi:hypothetical protein
MSDERTFVGDLQPAANLRRTMSRISTGQIRMTVPRTTKGGIFCDK